MSRHGNTLLTINKSDISIIKLDSNDHLNCTIPIFFTFLLTNPSTNLMT